MEIGTWNQHEFLLKITDTYMSGVKDQLKQIFCITILILKFYLILVTLHVLWVIKICCATAEAIYT